MQGSCFNDRRGSPADLSSADRRQLADIAGPERVYRRGATIRPERDRVSEAYIINSGWLFSFLLLGDGSRQILRLHLPGDIVSLSCLLFNEPPEYLAAVTDVSVCPVERGALWQLVQRQPRIAAGLLLAAQADQVALCDRLASVGRTDARARIAALLLDTMTRLRRINGGIRSSFAFPLTQEEIGDATGLTAVHVNRMIRALMRDGVIAKRAGVLTVLDEHRLRATACYADRFADGSDGERCG